MNPGMIKSALVACLLMLCLARSARAQFPYSQSFKNMTSPGLVVSGAARLTAAGGSDINGDGYLRLTDNIINNVGYVYAQDSFPSNYGLTASFEFFSWKTGANTTNQADGMTFFLFDASVNAFRPGGTGGSLGYAQYYTTPGMAKGYIGIAIDAFGNFSSASDGGKNGGPGQQRNSVSIRGPGNGRSVTDYVYQTGVIASDPAYNASFQAFSQRYPDSTQANYRRLKVIMSPGSSAGATIGYKVTVIMYKGGTPVTPVTLISNFDYPFVAPAKLQFGLSASTGAITNMFEVRNLNIDVTNSATLLAPTVNNDAGAIGCQGQQVLIDVASNDVSNNSGGSINKASIDLDPSTAGQQTSFTDAGKGTYSSNSNGIVSFTPISGYFGTSGITYKIDDNYGMTSTSAGNITVTINNTSGPSLIVTPPATVCSPATVNITSASVVAGSTPGASFNYFSSLSDANNNINNINASAAALATSGTYYIRAVASGCATVKPVTIEVSAAPTSANAGSDQSFCSSTGAQNITLLANNPDVGTGAWSQISGPSTAAISYPDAATSPVYNLAKGIYTFRWTTGNGACAASVDDVLITVGIPSNAGSNQSVVNATSATLAANTASPGTGLWSKISGPAMTFANTADPATTISGLLPGNTYVLSWKITNGGCASTSQVTVTNTLNTIANAGIDRTRTNILPFALEGNTPDVGNSGAWTVVSAPAGSVAAVLSPSSPTSTFMGISLYGDYTLRWTMTNGAYSNSDDVTYHLNSVLPLRFISFTAKLHQQKTTLQWRTADEVNTDHFEIERSIDGKNFKVVGSLKNNDVQHYSYDDDVHMVSVDQLYYRIKQVDQDDEFSYSGIVGVSLVHANNIAILKNPFTDVIEVSVALSNPETIEFKLYDAAGRLLLTKKEKFTSGARTIRIPTTNLKGGTYFLETTVGKEQRNTITLIKGCL